MPVFCLLKIILCFKRILLYCFVFRETIHTQILLGCNQYMIKIWHLLQLEKSISRNKHGTCIEAVTHENEKSPSPTLISTCLGNAPCEHRELTQGPGFTSFHQSAENCHIHSVLLKLDGRAINHQQCSSTSCFSFSLCPMMRALMWKATSYVLVMKYIGAQDCVCTFLGCGFF